MELTNSGRSANRVPAQSQLMWKQELGPSAVGAPHRGATRDESAASYRGNAEGLQVRNHLKREQFLCRDRATSATGRVIESLDTPVDRAGHDGHEQIFMAHFAETANRRQRAAAVPYSMRLLSSFPDAFPSTSPAALVWFVRRAVALTRRWGTDVDPAPLKWTARRDALRIVPDDGGPDVAERRHSASVFP